MSAPSKGGEKLIATNPNAFKNYVIQEKVEAGMVLQGTEVKSLREKGPNIRDAFVEIAAYGGKSLEAWLHNLHIEPYSHGNIWNHDPLRRRKLLLHEHQIQKLFGSVTQDGMTIVPIRMYFLKGRAKVELGLAKGKKKHDQRESIKRRQADREMAHAIKRGRR